MNPLKIPGLNTSWVIPAEEIMRIEAASSYSRIYFENGEKLVVPKVLHWFQDFLPPEMFVRVHRSHLINKLFVQKIKGHRSKSLVLNNGESITISRREKKVSIVSALILPIDNNSGNNSTPLLKNGTPQRGAIFINI